MRKMRKIKLSGIVKKNIIKKIYITFISFIVLILNLIFILAILVIWYKFIFLKKIIINYLNILNN